MKALLMHPDRDFDLDQRLPANESALSRDLGLDTLFTAMAGADEFLLGVAKVAVLSSLVDPAAISYRQRVLADCLRQPAVVRQIYELAVQAIAGEKKVFRGMLLGYPTTTLLRSVEVLELFVGILRQLRHVADDHAVEFQSDGFAAFFTMLTKELSDDYFEAIDEHLRTLRFRHGLLVSAEVGKGCKGRNYILRTPRKVKRSWVERLTLRDQSGYTLTIPDRDEAGARALSELRNRGLSLVANALAQSTDHVLSFFTTLRREVGFYVACLNLAEALTGKGEPVSFPEPSAGSTPTLSCRGLYDVGLALRRDDRVVGNDVTADNKMLVMITGANQGGKSTFLRSVGLAQLMMQCGMFVPAESFQGGICGGLFTHYKREEDATMESGKLDEELRRMSEIADTITPGAVLLCNESFAATNEREGSALARQIIRALLESGVKVFFVTHLFDLADQLYRQRADNALFLRAERRADGHRSFRLVEGEPLPTSYGPDLYERVFGPVRRRTTT